MEKGTLIITKKGGAKVKREDGKETNVISKYDYSNYILLSGKNRIDCEYEPNDKKQAVRVFIEGKELPKDTKAAAEKEAEERRKRQAELVEKKEAEEKKKNASLIQKMNRCSFNLSSDDSEYYLPKDTTETLNGKEWQVDNFYLRLNRGAKFDTSRKGKENFNFFATDKQGVKYKVQESFGDFDFSGLCKRAESQIDLPYEKLLLSPDWRLIIGLGGASVYETSITLHHIYGIPYIPASSIKGTVRSHILKEVFLPKYIAENNPKANEKAEEEAMDNPIFKLVFGNQGQKGKLVFYDAFPVCPPEIEVDIMNPHYGDYYNNKSAPVDTLKPVPVFFLTAARCDFQFLIGSKKKDLLHESMAFNGEEKNILEWLHSALTHHGIGAKTAVGYGYFNSKT